CETDPGEANDGLSAVLFSDSHVYVADGVTVASYVARTGALAWRTTISGYPDTTYNKLVISHGLVIVAGQDCHTTDPGGELVALHTSDGKQVWRAVPQYADQIYDVEVSGKYLVAHT